jgi:hypothetical protein
MSQATKGQVNRKNIRMTIENSLSRYCPNELDRMANLIAYDFNLSPYTVRYTYLPMFIDKGILVNNNGKFVLAVEVQQQQVKSEKKPEKEKKTDKKNDNKLEVKEEPKIEETKKEVSTDNKAILTASLIGKIKENERYKFTDAEKDFHDTDAETLLDCFQDAVIRLEKTKSVKVKKGKQKEKPKQEPKAESKTDVLSSIPEVKKVTEVQPEVKVDNLDNQIVGDRIKQQEQSQEERYKTVNNVECPKCHGKDIFMARDLADNFSGQYQFKCKNQDCLFEFNLKEGKK